MTNIEFYDWQNKIVETPGNVTIRGGRQDGKSTAVAKRIYELAKKYPGSKTLIIAAAERQENWIYEQVLDYIGKDYKGRSTLHLTTMDNGSQIFKFPVGMTGIYLEGLSSVDFLHADEAIHISERVWDSILPMLAEPRKRGLGWITLLSSTRGKPKGYFYESFSRKDFTQFHITSDMAPHVSKEFLEEEKIRLGERMFNVIYNGEFDELAMCYFPPELIDRAVKINCFKKEDISPKANYYIGIDPAKYGKSKAAWAVTELIDDKRMAVVHGEEMKQSSFRQMRAKTCELDRLFKSRQIFYDSGGLGQGFDEFFEEEPTIKNKLTGINNKAAGKEGKILKEDLYSHVRKLLESDCLILVNDPIIINGLKKVEFDANEKIIGTDMSEAIVRACRGMKEKHKKIRILRF